MNVTPFFIVDDELVAAMKRSMTDNGGLNGNNGKENIPFTIVVLLTL